MSLHQLPITLLRLYHTLGHTRGGGITIFRDVPSRVKYSCAMIRLSKKISFSKNKTLIYSCTNGPLSSGLVEYCVPFPCQEYFETQLSYSPSLLVLSLSFFSHTVVTPPFPLFSLMTHSLGVRKCHLVHTVFYGLGQGTRI